MWWFLRSNSENDVKELVSKILYKRRKQNGRFREDEFTTYVRTKTVFQLRLKDLKFYDRVKIYNYELDKLGVDWPVLWALKKDGQITYPDNEASPKWCRAIDMKGPIVPKLLDKGRKTPKVVVPLSDMHLKMRDTLKHVSVASSDDLPVYFSTFLKLRETDLDAFFTVDAFCGRVHTPVVNLKSEYRTSLRLKGEPVVSLDVKQMQPTILAKVLHKSVGKNPFSDAVHNGDDVYKLIQKSAGLEDRADAKLMFFRLVFGKPMDDIGSIFKGDTKWVEWINKYKTDTEPKNPHKGKPHTNLAWLLQYSEVKVMSEIWRILVDEGIDFLTIHDDILVRSRDEAKVLKVMNDVLSENFRKYDITITK